MDCKNAKKFLLQEWIHPWARTEEHRSPRPRRLATTAGGPRAPETNATDQVGDGSLHVVCV